MRFAPAASALARCRASPAHDPVVASSTNPIARWKLAGSFKNSGTSTLVSTYTLSIPCPAAQFRKHGLARGHVTARLGQLDGKCLAIPRRPPNGQRAIDGDLRLHGCTLVQAEPAHNLRRDSDGKAIAPFATSSFMPYIHVCVYMTVAERRVSSRRRSEFPELGRVLTPARPHSQPRAVRWPVPPPSRAQPGRASGCRPRTAPAAGAGRRAARSGWP
jgi:hypothetical protein